MVYQMNLLIECIKSLVRSISQQKCVHLVADLVQTEQYWIEMLQIQCLSDKIACFEQYFLDYHCGNKLQI